MNKTTAMPEFKWPKTDALSACSQLFWESNKRLLNMGWHATQEQHKATSDFVQELSKLKPSLGWEMWGEGYRKGVDYLESTQNRTKQWFENCAEENKKWLEEAQKAFKTPKSA